MWRRIKNSSCLLCRYRGLNPDPRGVATGNVIQRCSTLLKKIEMALKGFWLQVNPLLQGVDDRCCKRISEWRLRSPRAAIPSTWGLMVTPFPALWHYPRSVLNATLHIRETPLFAPTPRALSVHLVGLASVLHLMIEPHTWVDDLESRNCEG